MAFVMEEVEVKNIVNLVYKKIMIPFKVGDIVKDIKTDKIATIFRCYKGIRPYYFIVFNNNTGCYREHVFLTKF